MIAVAAVAAPSAASSEAVADDWVGSWDEATSVLTLSGLSSTPPYGDVPFASTQTFLITAVFVDGTENTSIGWLNVIPAPGYGGFNITFTPGYGQVQISVALTTPQTHVGLQFVGLQPGVGDWIVAAGPPINLSNTVERDRTW
ncbi:hypothetical protein [Serinibacter salmoneus]|uniref:hypothetical protein n=1 Tax=Serinibacter salmoneus TaxID=556530 RepID=UPI001179DB6F|nr:hypothetical protein [Serinibacter salmoneus]